MGALVWPELSISLIVPHLEAIPKIVLVLPFHSASCNCNVSYSSVSLRPKVTRNISHIVPRPVSLYSTTSYFSNPVRCHRSCQTLTCILCTTRPNCTMPISAVTFLWSVGHGFFFFFTLASSSLTNSGISFSILSYKSIEDNSMVSPPIAAGWLQ